jgi:two-component system CheB/CheR fusion protein
VIPGWFKGQPEGRRFRAWVPGCSTGEEAYGLAIIFREALARARPALNCSLQIFATDLDRDAIARARQGLFKSNIAADVSEPRLARFFTAEDGGFRVRKEIREMVVFAPQNLIMDPPFTRLDLLSCRNLLIYLAPELQKKLMLLFHYSLVPGGTLCLGSSESVGAGANMFIPTDPKNRLFRRGEAMLPAQALVFPPALASHRHGAKTEIKMADAPLNLAALADNVLLQQFSPPAVLVNEAGDIVYISGRTGKYLEPAAGKANWNLFAMAREGLRLDLASALHRAIRQDEPVITRDLKVGSNGSTQAVTLTVQRLFAPSPLRGLLMVVFRDQAPTPGARRRRPAAGDGRMVELEQELSQSRDELRNLQSEMQTSQEELKSTNEELQSTNEELQSTNEELTTSKEELQSLNEELQTINAEQLARMEDLSRTSSDMKNLLDATDIATVFLDGNLRVARFTQGASRLYKLLPGDVGRQLTDISAVLDYPDLAADARQVLRSLSPREKQVPAQDGRWYAVRIMSYRTPEDRIDGLVLTFTDVTAATRAEEQLRSITGQFQALLDRFEAGYALCDLVLDGAGRAVDGRMVSINPALPRLLGPGAQVGRTLAEAVPAVGPLCAEALAGLPATGEPRRFGQTLQVGATVLELTGYRSGPDQFVCLFKDIAQPGGVLALSS